jgi:hypothetical protein
VERLARIGNSGESANAAADRFDISGARAGFGATELLDQLGMLALCFGDILRIEVTELLRRGRRERQRGRGKQQDGSTHLLDPLSRFACELSAAILNGE